MAKWEGGLAGHRDEFDDGGHHFIATVAGEGHAELGAEEAVGFADIEAEALDFAGEESFAARARGEAGSEGELVRRFGKGVGEVFHDGLVENVHSEEAEIVTGAEAGNDELLFGESGSGFFEDVGDVVESLSTADTGASDDTVVGQLAFVRGLHCRDRALRLLGDFEELAEAGFFREREIKVVAHHKEKGIVAREVLGEEDGVTVTEGLGLFDEGDLVEMICDGGGEIPFGAGGDDDGGGVNPAGEDFIEKKRGRGLGLAGGTHEGLQRQVVLIRSCGGDDGFLDLHGMSGISKDIEA